MRDDARKGEEIVLPILQHTLDLLWRKRRGRWLTWEAYKEVGGVAGALRYHADQVIAGLAPDEEDMARRLFLRLIWLEGSGTFAGRRTDKPRLVEQFSDSAVAERLLQRLADQRLIVLRADGEEATAELIHDTLPLHWSRLRDWIQEDREFLLWRQRLRASLAGWERTGQDIGSLLRGALLLEAERWLEKRRDDLNADERHFVQESVALRVTEQASRRRKQLAVGAALVVTLIALVNVLLLLLQSPPSAWMTTEVSRLSTTRAALVKDQDGRESIRVITGAYEVISPDVGGVSHQVALELDLRGKITGCIGYINDEGILEPEPGECERYGGFGTLADEWNVFERLSKKSEEPVSLEPSFILQLFQNSVIGNELDDEALLGALPDYVQTIKRWLQDFYREYRMIRPRLFQYGDRHLLAFADLESRGNEFLTLTLPLRSDDQGENWQAGKSAPFTTWGLAGLTRGSADLQVFYAASIDHRGDSLSTGFAGGIFQSLDGGLSWTRMKLPEEWADWISFSDVLALPDEPRTIAVALDPKATRNYGGSDVQPRGVPGVLITRDGGKEWELLEAGLGIPLQSQIKLVGITASNDVIALVLWTRRNSSLPDDGRPIIWRRLTLRERLQAKYGVQF